MRRSTIVLSVAAAWVLVAAGLLVVAGMPGSDSAGATGGGVKDFLFSSGFSAEQGRNQWYYMQWDGATYSRMTWDPGNSQWRGGCIDCVIGRGFAHPGTNDAVIAWKAPRSGTVTVQGSMDDQEYTTLGDGVRTVIKKQSGATVTKVWPSTDYQVIRPNFMARHVVKVSVAANDMLYFQVNRNVTANRDSLAWDPRITYDFEPKFTLDDAELVMTPDDFQRVGVTVAQDSSLSVVPSGGGFDFYHSGDFGTVLSKFHGTLAQPAQHLTYAKNVFKIKPRTGERWWIANMYQTPDGKLLAFCHIENADTARTGWWAIGLAYSVDGGTTFTELGKIVTQSAMGSSLTTNIQGVPYVIRDGDVYVYYTESDNQPGVARAPLAEVLAAADRGTVSAWHKYHDGGWSESGLHGQSSPIMQDGTLYGTHGDAAYSTYLGKYMIAGQVSHAGSGIFLSFSDDAVTYGAPSWIQHTDLSTKDSLSPYETIVDVSGSDNGVVGQSFYVYFNYRFRSDNAARGDLPTLWRWLYRQKVTLNRAGFTPNG